MSATDEPSPALSGVDPDAATADPLAALVQSFRLTPLGPDRFEGRAVERARPRLFGGELLAHTVMAACRTVEGRGCHSLHVHFLFPGRPGQPLEYHVRRLQDGRRFARRLVSGWQRGREIMVATVSFDADQPGLADLPAAASGGDAGRHPGDRGHQVDVMPAVPGPEGLRSELDYRIEASGSLRETDRPWLLMPRAVDIRQAHPVPLIHPPAVPPVAHTWLRTTGPLPDDPALHQAVLAYASDMTLLDIACYPYAVSWIDSRVEQASLDHAMWFHRPFRVDDWLLYAQAVPTLASGRAFARGSVFARDGGLVASVTQEGLSRIRPA